MGGRENTVPGRAGICLWVVVLAGLTGGAVGVCASFSALLGLEATAGVTGLLTGTLLYWLVAAGMERAPEGGLRPAQSLRGWLGTCAGRLGLLAVTLPVALAILARSFPLTWPVAGMQLLWLALWLFFFFALARLLGRWYFPLLLAVGAVLHLSAWLGGQLFLLREGVRMPVADWQEFMPLQVLKNGGPAAGGGWLLAGALLLCGAAAVWFAGYKSKPTPDE